MDGKAADPSDATNTGARPRWAWGRRGWTGWDRFRTAPQLTPRLYLLLVSLPLLGLSLAQQPGKTVIDTKPALALNPTYYLGQQLHLWNAAAEGGSIPNQTVGYLTPLGPYFLFTHALGIPPATAQRLWLALLLIVACWGAVRLCDALGVGNRVGRLLAGLSYAASPWALSRLGDLSLFVIGGVMLPWILLPLVRYTHGHDRAAGGLTARQAAARSGLAVFLIGGTNASVALDVLVAPALWLMLMCRGRAAWSLRVWWAVSVVAAIFWWLVSLVIQGRYGIHFLPYTETATTTTATTSLPETIRGTPDWFDYLRYFGGSASAWTYISTTVGIIGSFAVAGLGMIGLTRAHIPARRFLLACFAVGVVAIAAAYPGPTNGIWANSYRDLLAGGLAALRNVTKFEPLVRLPLAIGLAACVPALATVAQAKWRRWRRSFTVAVAMVVTAAVVLAAAPLGLMRIYQDNDFKVPGYWKTAAAWLNRSATDSRTLLIPGTAFAEYSWGDPRDEPVLWLAKTDWAVRDLIPFGSINGTRWLDGIEQQLSQRSAPNLAATLTRAGIGYLLVKNDLVKDSSDPPASSGQIHAALASSKFKRVASFGPMVADRASGLEKVLHVKAPTTRHPALEVYAVPGAAKVNAYPTADLAVLSGGPEALTTLGGSSVLGDRPTVLAADVADPAAGHAELPKDVRPQTWIDTDTLQRRQTSYGSVHDAQSYLLTAGSQAARATLSPQIRLDVDPVGHETVASYDGISNVSSSGNGFVLRQFSAYSGAPLAVDGNPLSSWTVSNFLNRNVGQWIQLEFKAPRQLPAMSVQLPNGPARITALRVTTSSGSRVTQLRNTTASQPLQMPANSRPSSSVRLTIDGVAGPVNNLAGVGISEIHLAGTAIERHVVLPSDVTKIFGAQGAKTLTYAFQRERGDPLSPINIDGELELDRVFTVPRRAELTASGTAVLRSGGISLPANTGATVDLACGSGPNVRIDNQRFQTYVNGSRAALLAGSTIPLGLCTTRPITLTAGTHTLTTTQGSAAVSVASLILTNQTSAPAASARTAKVGREWGLEHREVDMSAGASSILTVHENFSTTWTATANGKALKAIQVDGWQQGFIVPAGGAVTVKLTNNPGIVLRIGLLVGAVAVFLLMLAAVVPGRRRRAGVIATSHDHRLRVSRLVSLVTAIAVTALVAGPLTAACVPLLALVVWLVRRSAPVLVLAAFGVVIGVSVGNIATYPAAARGVFSSVTQVAMALAIAVVVLAAGARGAEPAGLRPDPAAPEDGVAREPANTESQRVEEANPAGDDVREQVPAAVGGFHG